MKWQHTILKGSQTLSEKIMQLNEKVNKGQLKEWVQGSIQETLNDLLEAAAENLAA